MDETIKGMRRHKNLFGKVISFQNLLLASKLAQKGKRFKEATARFNDSLENELWTLHEELSTETYQSGPYRDFTIYEPKKRLISAAPYRDRNSGDTIRN